LIRLGQNVQAERAERAGSLVDKYASYFNKEGLTFREMIMIGSTRNCFDTLKVVAVLQWLMDWAETVWRPWFLSLIAQDDA
ncbi:hypothetical protein PtrEW7m1_012205, partial [Pyrenophora tritici-repentis]